MARRLRGKRILGPLLTCLTVFVVVIGGLLLLAVPFARQATELAVALPERMSNVQGRIAELQAAVQARGIALNLDSIRSQATSSVVGGADIVLGGLIREAASIGGAITDRLLVLVISVYLLAGAPSIHRNTMRVMPARYRGVHEFVRTSAARVMGGYLRGQLIMSLVIGVLAGVGTGLLGVP
jgi:predicted PurR-regulated permease PerM